MLFLFFFRFFIRAFEIFFLIVKTYLTRLMSVAVALLDPTLSAMSAKEGFIVLVNTQVVFEAADSSELLVTVRFLAGPNLVHSSRGLVSLVAHRVFLSHKWLESFVARFGAFLPLLDLQPREMRQ